MIPFIYDKKCHKNDVNDVSWASTNGRSFDLVASCGIDGIFVWNIKCENSDFNIYAVSELIKETAWKVCWNIMATILASNDENN